MQIHQFKRVNEISKYLVFGYIHNIQILLPTNNIYFNIPIPIYQICSVFYYYPNNHKKIIYGIGFNYSGELGLGHRDKTEQLTQISFKYGNIKHIYRNFQNYFIINEKNDVYCVGRDDNGNLGIESWQYSYDKDDWPNAKRHTKIHRVQQCQLISQSHTSSKTYMVSQNNTIYEFGGSNSSHDKNKLIIYQLKQRVIDIKCGSDYLMLLDSNNKIWVKGNNRFGQIGLGKNIKKVMQLTLIALNDKIIDIDCAGDPSSFCVNDKGELIFFGEIMNGILNEDEFDKDERYIFKPLKVPYFIKNNICMKQVRCGREFVCMLDNKGRVYVCGGSKLISNDLNIKSVHCGWYHCILMTQNKELYALGNNDFNGCCLDSKKFDCYSFTQPTLISRDDLSIIKEIDNGEICDVICGDATTLIVFQFF